MSKYTNTAGVPPGILSALSEPSRQKILDLLKKEEMAVTDIGEHFSFTMPTLSHHLDTLYRAGLISKRRDGVRILYSANMSVMEELAEKVVKLLTK